MEIEFDSVVDRIQNKIKRTPRFIWVYFVNKKFVATTSPDAKLLNSLVGVYDGRAKTYRDDYVDADIRWMARAS